MRILLFHKEHVKKILSGTKTMTARCWKQKPFQVGDMVRAQTNYNKSSAFAILRITEVSEWDGNVDNIPIDKLREITRKEGFKIPMQFSSAWYSTNDDRLFENKYKSYFFEFEVV